MISIANNRTPVQSCFDFARILRPIAQIFRSPWVFAAIAIAYVVCSVANINGRIIHFEVMGFPPSLGKDWLPGALHDGGYINTHLSGRPILEIIFNEDKLGWGIWQARQLGYLFDNLDCRFILMSVKLGYPHFLSLTHYLFIVLIGFLFWRFFQKDLHLDALSATCLILLFWTTPTGFFWGVAYRSSKSGLSLIVAILLIHFYRTIKHSNGNGIGIASWLSIAGLGFAGTLFDRQGVFLLMMAFVFFGLRALFVTSRESVDIVTSLIVAIILTLLYTYHIGPALVAYFHHTSLAFTLERLPWAQFLLNPLRLKQGWELTVNSFRWMAGNLDSNTAQATILTLTGFFVVTLVWIKKDGKTGRSYAVNYIPGIAFATIILLIILLNAVMVEFHAAVYAQVDSRRIYYWLPAQTLQLMAMGFAVFIINSRRLMPKAVVQLVLIALFVGNLVHLPGHKEMILNTTQKAYYDFVPELTESLRHLEDPAYASDHPAYKLFKSLLSK